MISFGVLFVISHFILQTRSGLAPNGQHVCRKDVAYTAQIVVTEKRVQKQYYHTCCRYIFKKCVQKCKKSRDISRSVTVKKVVPKLRAEYYCCPGWTNKGKTQCYYPVCKGSCDPGICIAPDECQIKFNSQVGFKQAVLKQNSCGGNIINIAGSATLMGAKSPSFLDTQFCEWRIQIPYLQKTKFYFSKFAFNTGTDCASSIITISTSKLDYLFCSERPPKKDMVIVFDRSAERFFIKAINRNWSSNEGFQLIFKESYTL